MIMGKIQGAQKSGWWLVEHGRSLLIVDPVFNPDPVAAHCGRPGPRAANSGLRRESDQASAEVHPNHGLYIPKMMDFMGLNPLELSVNQSFGPM
jgi:hypothetical protein